MSKKSLHSKRCWVNGTFCDATVVFEKGIVTEISQGRHGSADTVGDLVLMPGAIDAHVHINEPGRTEWEGFDTATKAAAAGGITTVVDMPLNSSPVTTTPEAFEQKLQSSKGKLHVNIGFYGGVVPGNEHQLVQLVNAGVLGIKAFLTHSGIDEFPNVTEHELSVAMAKLSKHDIPLLAHCELTDIHHSDELYAHPTCYSAYLSSRPKEWENKAVDLMILLCRRYKCPTHIVHVSSADALTKIKAAKNESLPLTAETCPHYLLFNAEDVPDKNTRFKCAPPIRERANNLLLKQAFLDETLNFLASDHSPAPPAIKEIESGNLQKAWGGIAGLQFLLSASWTSLRDMVTLENFIPLLTNKPAKFLRLHNRKGKIEVGYDADFVIWSPEESFTAKAETTWHKHKISPYFGQRLYGNIYQTYVNGELVSSSSNIVNKNKGSWLLRK